MLQSVSKANARARGLQLNRLFENMPMPWVTYREQVENGLKHIIVSHKPDHGYQGAMHEETAWGLRANGIGTRRVKEEGSSTRSRIEKNMNLVEINSTSNKERHGLTESGDIKAYKGYVGGSNFCIEICEVENGKWVGEVISTFKAYQVIRSLGEVDGYQRLMHPLLSQSEKKLVMRLMINDYITFNNDKNNLMRVVKISGNSQIYFAPHNEANVDSRNRDNGNSFAYISKMAGSLKTAKASKVAVTPIGKVVRLIN